MNNYIFINNQKIELTDEQVKLVISAQKAESAELSSFAVGETVKIGDHLMVILEQFGKETALIRKELLPDTQFGTNNNFDGSYVDEACRKFAQELMEEVGEDNVVPHVVDLTSDDGLKDYGTVDRYASLITADQYRKYVAVLDQHKPDDWWWLSTAYSTPTHDNSSLVKCVSPSGYVSNFGFDNYDFGVRPVLNLKSEAKVIDGAGTEEEPFELVIE